MIEYTGGKLNLPLGTGYILKESYSLSRNSLVHQMKHLLDIIQFYLLYCFSVQFKFIDYFNHDLQNEFLFQP